MKKSLLALLLISLFIIAANSQKYEWLQCTESSTTLNATLVASDGAGNVYSTAKYNGTVYVGGDTLTSGTDDLFLAKHDGAGNYQWILPINGTDHDYPIDIVIDMQANIYLAINSRYGGVITLPDTVVNIGGNGINLFCFDTSGAFKWMRPQSGANLKLATTLTISGVYVIDNNTVQRIDAQGNLIWQKAVTNSLGGTPGLTAIGINSAGKLAIAGYTSGLNGSGGAVTYDTVTVAYPNENHARFVFYGDTSGTGLWGNEIGHNVSLGAFYVSSIAISNNTEDLYLGTYEGTGPYHFANDTVINVVNPSHAWAGAMKFSALGVPQWMRVFYALNADIYDVVLNNSDELVMVGTYSNSNYGYFGSFTLPPSGVNPFVGKLNSQGNYIWVKIDPRTVNDFSDAANSIALVGGNAYAVSGTWYHFYGFLNPYQHGCHAYTPTTYPGGSFIELISEAVEPVPAVDFLMLQSGSTVLLKNTTPNASSFQWALGNGSNSTLSEPIQTYTQPGVYNVCLSATNNCGSGQMCKQVAVNGIREIVSNHGVTDGVVTSNIYGGGFTANSTVLLKRSGSPAIVPYYTRFINSGNLEVRLDLTGVATGPWDVEVTVPGDTIMTLAGGFTIDSLEPYQFDITYSGPVVSRTIRWVPSTATVHNKSNQDAVGVIVLYRLDQGWDIFINESFTDPQSNSFLNTGHQYLVSNSINPIVGSSSFNHTSTSSVHGAFIIPLLKANSSYTLPVYLRGMNSIESAKIFSVGGPLLMSSSLTGTMTSYPETCLSSRFKVSVEQSLAVSISESQWNACFPPLYDSLRQVICNLANDSVRSNVPVSIPGLAVSVLARMSSSGCVAGIPAVLNEAQMRTIVSKLCRNVVDSAELTAFVQACPDVSQVRAEPSLSASNLTNNGLGVITCMAYGGGLALFGPLVLVPPVAFAAAGISTLLCIIFNHAIDPNALSGPGNNVEDIWQKPGDYSAYTISFENADTATAAAGVVLLTDTLEKDRFDLNTFRFTQVTIGDSLKFSFTEPGFSQLDIRDVSLSSIALRTEATIDTSTGVVKWILSTVDRVNYQPDTNSVTGFLPPNTNGTEGTGHVSYHVQLKRSLVTGDSIHNKATIVFDNNTPITTNDWLNVIDITKPQSAVNALPPVSSTSSFVVSWSGSDYISGILAYNIYVSDNDSTYKLWLSGVDTNQYIFNGIFGHQYEFVSIAIDKAGNIEDAPADPQDFPDAVTTPLLTGLKDAAGVSNVLVYPNPFSGTTIAEINLSESGKVVISISNAVGSEVKRINAGHISAGTHRIELALSDLPQGIYQLKLEANGTTFKTKLIKQ